MSEASVREFFDELTPEYTAAIERCFPRYREMLESLIEETENHPHPSSVLELGCGTGNLSLLLAAAYPNAALRLVDISDESLRACQTRFKERPQVEYESRDFRELVYPRESFDLVASSISIHHLNGVEKQHLFQNCFQWLRPGGMIVYADQFSGADKLTYTRHQAAWRKISLAAGATVAEFEVWQQHQREHDHHDSLCSQLDWLRAAGFRCLDCTWRYLLWAVVIGVKQA